MMKTLVTERLILRELNLEDIEDFYFYCKKPHIGPMAGWAPHTSIHMSYEILKMMIKENEVWGITIKPNDKVVGTIGLHVRNFDNAIRNQKEIGYVLDDAYWGYGYALEAVKAVLAYAFDTVELDKVLCGHADNNHQSKRVIEKAKFRWTHEEKRDHYDHTKINIQMYELTKKEYEEMKHDNIKNKI